MKLSIHGIITLLSILLAMSILWLSGVTVYDYEFVSTSPWTFYIFDNGLGISPDQFDLLIYNVACFGMVLVWITWFHRTYARQRALGKELKFSPWLATFGWIIPFANLFLVPLAVRDAWRLSVPGEKRGWIVWIWWAMWLVGGFAVSFVIMYRFEAFMLSDVGHSAEAMGFVEALSMGNMRQVFGLLFGVHSGVLLKALSLMIFGPWLYIVWTLEQHVGEDTRQGGV